MINIGDEYSSKKNGRFKVVGYINSHKIEVEFLETGYRTFASGGAIRKGNVKDYLCRTFYGVGFPGGKEYSNTNLRSAYNVWASMLCRCYSDKYHILYPSYIGCKVSNDWHNFQNFARWYLINIPNSTEKLDIDKDLIKKGNKIYCEEYCSFVPYQINRMLEDSSLTRGEYPVGVGYSKAAKKFRGYMNGKHLGLFDSPSSAFFAYKIEKERFVKSQAEKYKPILNKNVYKNLMSYVVTDDTGLCR